MGYIKNFDKLATSKERKDILTLIETAFTSIQPEEVAKRILIQDLPAGRQGSILKIQDKEFDLSKFKRVFLIGFGKGASKNAFLLEPKISQFLTEGYVIDTEPQAFQKIQFTTGTHPLPSPENFAFTEKVVSRMTECKLTPEDLVFVIICGGGSAMFEKPIKITFEEKKRVDTYLLESGATISEMNVIRKHLSAVKGGGLAKILHPATVATLIYSDVPGNDLSTIASGPTVKDPTTMQDVAKVIEKFNFTDKLRIPPDSFIETPKDDELFRTVTNILVLSNRTAIDAMSAKAKKLGYHTNFFSDKFQSEAKVAGKTLIDATTPHEILLAGGETTVKVTGSGIGGRNQELILGSLPQLTEGVLIASFDSDGWDNSPYAGALADADTVQRSRMMGLDPASYLTSNNSSEFFKQTGDFIETGRLPSNVSDLMIVLRK